ncbi:peptidylprolyl isomerase [Bacillus sp. DJP31]|uniref:peptidylprolyl isomerase n=1 Tax=Bacillus sp. DJP31 TaxID=3409789 RepID=UPI003BB67242
MMKIKFAVVVMLMFLLTACGTAKEQTAESKDEKTKSTQEQSGSENPTTNGEYRQLTPGTKDYPKVEMVTSKGTIILELYPDVAPKAVENFLTHSKNGYYEGLSFHRVINDFMIQGGDPTGTGGGGESIFGKDFEDEFSDEVYNLRGALSMANSGPNTNGSQFFIVQKKSVEPDLQQEIEKLGYPEEISKAYSELGGTHWLDNNHTVFGHVIEGLDILDAIAGVEVGAREVPKKPVLIEKINVIE